jgi:cytochrome c6
MRKKLSITILLLSICCTVNLSFIKGTFQNAPLSGKAIFEKNCARCHGSDGKKGSFGAKDLKLSTLSDLEAINIITIGKKRMPSFQKKLTQQDIVEVKKYVMNFRN